MTRPLERLGIDALEAQFGRADATDDYLLDLKEELEIRTTQRAKGLLNKVLEQLSKMQKVNAASSMPPAPAPKTQGNIPVPVPVFVASPTLANTVRTASQATPVALDSGSSLNSALPGTSAVMSHEQALRILKVPVTASWEQIEKSRRNLVARAQPDRLIGLAAEKRKALQDECRQVNTAYKALWQIKT